MSEAGRPSITEEQYEAWFKSLTPWLENGNSLYYAIKQSGLLQHKSLIFQKYNLKDWFMEKVDAIRREPGELVNEGIITQVRDIVNKLKRHESVTSDENKVLMFFAEKHRSAQQFFVNRFETAPAKPIEELLTELDKQGNDTIDDVAETFTKQGVETNPPVQNQGQSGEVGTLPTEPNATQA